MVTWNLPVFVKLITKNKLERSQFKVGEKLVYYLYHMHVYSNKGLSIINYYAFLFGNHDLSSPQILEPVPVVGPWMVVS